MDSTMIEKIGTIKNPLTIIAIFAGIVEISGTLILPFIEKENQEAYIWFLMVFPFVLVVVFFLTLNFNHKVLYAPSDYKNEDNFLKSLSPATYTERAKKFEEELEESAVVSKADQSAMKKNDPDSLSYQKLLRRSAQASYMLSEELVFAKLQREYPSKIVRGVKNDEGKGIGYIFDGFISEKSGATIIEVKYVRNGGGTSPIHRLQDTVNRIERSVLLLPNSVQKNIRLLLAIVTDAEGEISMSRIQGQLDAVKSKATIPVEIRLYNLTDLENEIHSDT